MGTSSRRRSLRARLVALHALAVALVVSAFGTAVCYVFWQSLLSQIDAEVHGQAMLLARALRTGPDSSFDLDVPAEARAYFSREDGRAYYGIWTAEGRRVDASDLLRTPAAPAVHGIRTREGRRETAIAGPAGSTVVVGRELGEARADLRALAATVIAGGAAATMLSILAGWLFAGRALAPLARIGATAQRMVVGDLTARIPVADTETELGQVAHALNAAFDRLQAAADQASRFTADASHELRTPVATLQAETEWALAHADTVDAFRESMQTCQAATRRIARTVSGLLLLARHDAVALLPHETTFRMDEAIDELARLALPVAEQRDVRMTLSLEPVTIRADREQLQVALSNLIFNAIHYSRPGGHVDVRLDVADHHLRVLVHDTGVGIPAEHRPRIFERFYRGDDTRAFPEGSGLGLPIAKQIIEMHGGSVRLASTGPVGTQFLVDLPLRRG
jgi:two-component system OmpR family sensor kinase